MVLTGFRHITEAIESWRAAGLYLPCDTACERRRIQQVWLERYKDTDAAVYAVRQNFGCWQALSTFVRYGRGFGRGQGQAKAASTAGKCRGQ